VVTDDLHRDHGGEGAHEDEVQQAGGAARRRGDGRLGGDEHQRRHEHDHDREDDDVDRARAAHGEELRRLAEQVEQRLCERECRQHREVQRVPPQGAAHRGWAR
jgi:hypothetical protein